MMIRIQKDNVQRIVSEPLFHAIWKPKGFYIVDDLVQNDGKTPSTVDKQTTFTASIAAPNLDQMDAVALRAYADARGIKYHHMHGEDKLREVIRDAKSSNQSS